MGDALALLETLAWLVRGVVRALGAGGLGLLSLLWCLDAVLPPVHYPQAQYVVSRGTKGWDLLSGHDSQGQAFKVRYLRSSGAIPELPGQHGRAVDLMTSHLPMLGGMIGSDLLAVTRLEQSGDSGVRERHWTVSLSAWWLRVLAHVLGGVLCGTVACTLMLPYVRWLRQWRRPEPRQALPVGEEATAEEALSEHPLFARVVHWQATADPFFPYAVQMPQEWWEIRLNDFPTEPMYTLMIEGNAVVDFTTWPSTWSRPEAA
ncbi:MAG: hypothetical protein AB7N91_27025 [Candidatus Tectimicrobiota bacterium]